MLDCDISRFSWKMNIKDKKTISWKFIYIFCQFWQTNLSISAFFFWFFFNIHVSWIVTHEHKSRSPSNLDHFWGKFCPLLKTINIQGFIWVEEKWSPLNIFFRYQAKTSFVGLWHLRSTDPKNQRKQIWMHFKHVNLNS